jgi:ligand-binding sensor domain-containing protein
MVMALPDGDWVHILREPTQVQGVLSDTGGAIYLLPSGKVYRDGRFDSIPALKGTPHDVVLRDRDDFWVAGRDYGPDGVHWQNPDGLITRFKAGMAVRYDTANSCLDGNLFRLLGLDREGRLIVDQRYFHGLFGPTRGVVRFDGRTCEAIDLGLTGDLGAEAYARDSAGREYFSIREVSDTPRGHGLVRLQGGRLDTLDTVITPRKLVVRGGEVYGATSAGFAVFSDTETRQITRILGRELPGVHDFLFDSRGVLWIGTEGYSFSTVKVGLVAISGKDTAIYNQDNSGFPGYFASALVEDARGNIWVGTWEKGLAVFARDRSVLAVARDGRRGHAGKPARYRPLPLRLRDLLGRFLPGAGAAPVP